MIYHKRIFIAVLLALAYLLPAALVLSPTDVQASTIPKAPNNLGLVGYWSLNEGTGTVANDYSGYGNDATTTTATWTAGRFGNALSLNGTSGYVALGSPKFEGKLSSFTASIWVKPTTITTQANIFFNLNGGGALYPRMYLLSNGALFLQLRTGGVTQSLQTINTIGTNNWSHITVTFDGSTNVGNIYINGVLSTTTTYSAGTLDGAVNGAVNVGYDPNLGKYFNGSMDEFRVYNRALSATEVAALYKAGGSRIAAPVSPGTLGQGLLGWWTFDGADIGSSFVDRSGGGFNGYLVGTNNSTTSRKTVGKVGQAFAFGGQNTGGIDLGNSASLDPNRFTIAGWIYVRDPQTHNYNYIYSNARDNCLSGGTDGIDFKVYAAGILNGAICNGSTAHTVSGPSIATSTWTYVAFSYDGANMRLYKNGVLAATQSNTTDPGATAVHSYIGSMGNGSGAIFTMNGKIDDLRTYNRALSAAEIQTLYNLTAGTHANASSASLDNGTSLQSGLVGHWTFDGKDMYQNVADLSGQGNVGTFVGVTSTSSAVTLGKLGQAMLLNSNDAVTVTNSGNLSLDTGTLVAWIKTKDAGSSFRGIYVQNTAAGMYLLSNALATYDNGAAASRTTGITLNDGKWHQVAMSFNSGVTNGTLMYIDGVQQLQTTITNTGHGTAKIGEGQGGVSQRFNGAIDDVRVYNRILSAAEITQLYNQGK